VPLSDDQFFAIVDGLVSDAALSVRRLSPDDAPSIVALNDSAYPAVPITSVDALRELLDSPTLLPRSSAMASSSDSS